MAVGGWGIGVAVGSAVAVCSGDIVSVGVDDTRAVGLTKTNGLTDSVEIGEIRSPFVDAQLPKIATVVAHSDNRRRVFIAVDSLPGVTLP